MNEMINTAMVQDNAFRGLLDEARGLVGKQSSTTSEVLNLKLDLILNAEDLGTGEKLEAIDQAKARHDFDQYTGFAVAAGAYVLVLIGAHNPAALKPLLKLGCRLLR